MNFSPDAMADFEGLLEVNRKICKQQMAEKASPTLPTNCAVLPKKIFALILCIATVCLSACALAETEIYWSGRSTSGFPSWSTPDKSTGAKWHIEWGEGTNIAANRRAVMRAMSSNGNYASPLYVYSSKSTAYHRYEAAYAHGKAQTYAGGRLDDRDGAQAPLTVTGYFFN